MTAPTKQTPIFRNIPPLPAALCAELAKLDAEGILCLLGEIVEPGINTPFDYNEDFQETLSPVTDAYRDAYKSLVYVAAGDHIESPQVGFRRAWTA